MLLLICKEVKIVITIEKVGLDIETADRLYELGIAVTIKNGNLILEKEE